jgi:hypothetical protein
LIQTVNDRSIVKKCQDLIRDRIGSEVKGKHAKTTPFNENIPGTVIKIEFESIDDKNNILKEKRKSGQLCI